MIENIVLCQNSNKMGNLHAVDEFEIYEIGILRIKRIIPTYES